MPAATKEGDKRAAITRSEYEDRRGRLAKACQQTGMAGAVAWSRGGSVTDRAGYGLYLANYYAEWFYLNDFAPHWACRGHNAVVVPAHGEAALVKDVRYFDAEAVSQAIDDVRQDFNLNRAIIAILREKGLDHGRLGIIGSDIVPWIHLQEIQRALPGLEWVPADDLLIDQMLVKSPAELQLIRKGCAIVDEVTDDVLQAAQPGVSQAELAGRVAEGLTRRGARLGWVRPNTIKRLEQGEIYPLAVIGWYQGYFFDVSRSRVVRAKPNAAQSDFLNMLNEFVLRQAEELRPGRAVCDAAEFGYRYFTAEKKVLTREEIESGFLGEYACFGHGLGLNWSRPNVRAGDQTVITPGMYMTAEVVYPHPSLGRAEAEINLEITETGPKILTKL